MPAGSDIFWVARNQTSAEGSSSSIQREEDAFLSPPCRKWKVMAVPWKQEKKGYPWSQSPWAARGHFMGSPVHLCTPLTARGRKSASPLKLMGESDLSKEVNNFPVGSKRVKSLAPDWDHEGSCIVTKLTWSRHLHSCASWKGFWNDLSSVLSNAKHESNRTLDLSQHSNVPVSAKYISLKYNTDQKIK